MSDNALIAVVSVGLFVIMSVMGAASAIADAIASPESTCEQAADARCDGDAEHAEHAEQLVEAAAFGRRLNLATFRAGRLLPDGELLARRPPDWYLRYMKRASSGEADER